MAETPRSKRGKALVLAGVLLLAAALAWTAYNLMDAQRAERSVTQALEALEEMEPTPPPATSPAQDPAPGETLADPDQPMPTVEVAGNGYIGRLDLPSLGLSLPVLGQWSSDLLKLAPCRYQGSAYQQDLIIAGHNYRSHFGRLNQAQVGDAVRFTDGAGTTFSYVVSEIQQLSGTAIEEMAAGDWDLTLFTCTLGGQARLTLRCTQVGM